MHHSTRHSDLNPSQTSDFALSRSLTRGIAVQPPDGLQPPEPGLTPHSTALPAPLQPVGCRVHCIVLSVSVFGLIANSFQGQFQPSLLLILLNTFCTENPQGCLALCFRPCSSIGARGVPDSDKRPEVCAHTARTATNPSAKRCLSWPLHSLRRGI
jgi:hypothetical protein